MVVPSRTYLTVEVKPEQSSFKSNSSSPPSSPNKAVRFVHCVTSEARPLTNEEQWSFYHFEAHARQCAFCYNPAQVFTEGRHFCSYGKVLEMDVGLHAHMVDGVVCSTKKENHKHVRIQLPKDYSQLPQLLAIRKKRRSSTVRSDEVKPVAAPHRSYDRVIDGPMTEVRPLPRRASSFTARVRTPSPMVEDDSSTASLRSSASERRGSLYDPEGATRRRTYRVEVRTPERKERSKEHESRRSRDLRK